MLAFIRENNECLFKMGERLGFQVFITFFMFSCYSFAFSYGLFHRYGTSENMENHFVNVAGASLMIGCFLFAVLSFWLFEDYIFGEFKNKFKNNWLTKSYIPFTLIYRFTIGFCLSCFNEYEYITLFLVLASMIYVMFNIINLPFRNVYRNYFGCLCAIT